MYPTLSPTKLALCVIQILGHAKNCSITTCGREIVQTGVWGNGEKVESPWKRAACEKGIYNPTS